MMQKNMMNFSYCNNEKREELKKLSNGIKAKYINNVHSKLLIKDNDLLCVGSFNWLSAQRKSKYVRHETSIVYQGKSNNVDNEIKLLKGSFESHFFTTAE